MVTVEAHASYTHTHINELTSVPTINRCSDVRWKSKHMPPARPTSEVSSAPSSPELFAVVSMYVCMYICMYVSLCGYTSSEVSSAPSSPELL